jgi:hypothetical protein
VIGVGQVLDGGVKLAIGSWVRVLNGARTA